MPPEAFDVADNPILDFGIDRARCDRLPMTCGAPSASSPSRTYALTADARWRRSAVPGRSQEIITQRSGHFRPSYRGLTIPGGHAAEWACLRSRRQFSISNFAWIA
jgi:hypothetical protein